MSKEFIWKTLLSDKIIEELADQEHYRWSKWMDYLFSICRPETGQYDRETGALVIPASYVRRWKRQARTAYPQLSDEEKESDRLEARATIYLILKKLEEAT